ncbi:conserved hypothetical protein [Coccidioides posadasii str. Silveira]|uniref:Uncharacterized protein n=1 Tax=Coccidioides posadasii (strain RMSCC 757 / Silveira) TaxID=443226 RepID=E9D3L2_COCPS|nr:conserved hypothetical protein [Coccidioides posadasii str. Silveira]
MPRARTNWKNLFADPACPPSIWRRVIDPSLETALSRITQGLFYVFCSERWFCGFNDFTAGEFGVLEGILGGVGTEGLLPHFAIGGILVHAMSNNCNPPTYLHG